MAKNSKKKAARKPARKSASKPAVAAARQRDPRRSSLKTPKISDGFTAGENNPVAIVDQLDEAVFLLRTIELAMSADDEWGEGNEQTMALGWATRQAIGKLLPLRNQIYSLSDRALAA